MAERRSGTGGIRRQVSGCKTSLGHNLKRELGVQKTPTPSMYEGGYAQACVLCLLQQQTCASKVPTKRKEKGELSAALYDVQKGSPESPRNECCTVPGRALWQEEHGLYFLITLWP